MTTVLRLAVTELRRLTAGRLARAALLALVLVPTIYSGLYLWANKDPYGALDRVPAAVVVEDTGTTLADGAKLTAGQDVGDQLVASKSFDWHRVGRAQALAGVDDGTYDFALLVPAGFSTDLASSAGSDPRQGRLELVTNDANNYLARSIAGQLAQQVTKTVAEKVTSQAARGLLVGFSTIHDQVAQAADGATKLQQGAASASSGAQQLASGAGTLVAGEQQLVSGTTALASGADRLSSGAQQANAGAGTLASGLATLDSATSGLPAQTARLASGAQQVAAGNAQVASVGAQVVVASQQATTALTTDRAALDTRLTAAGLTAEQVAAVNDELDKVAAPVSAADGKVQQANGRLQQLSAGAAQVAQGAQQLASSAGPLQSGIHQAATGAATLRAGTTQLAAGASDAAAGAHRLVTGQQDALTGAQKLQAGAQQLATGTQQLQHGAAQLADGLAKGTSSIPDLSPQARTAAAETIGSPVAVDQVGEAKAATYGAGLAPFFLSLALWIGAYTLFLVVKPLSSRAVAARVRSPEVAIAGWLAPSLAAAVQAVVALAVVGLVLRIDVAHPAGALGLMVLASLTFVAILQALKARLGAVGTFLGLVLMVVQLVSAGGTFPWQTLPAPLRAVHEVMPMTYAIDGLRRLMYGADLAHLTLDVTVLLVWLVAALTWSSWAARRSAVWTPARLKPELSL